MLAIIVPAHDEENHLDACLASLEVSAKNPALRGEAVVRIVVLDDCTDGTAHLVQRHGATAVTICARNVGMARSAGASFALRQGARWLAFTDADSTVAADWLAAQLAQNSDAVCGTVSVDDWDSYGERMKAHFSATYNSCHGHRHIHGANLGVSASAYQKAGGFAPLACSEDVALVRALEACGCSIAWSAAPQVVTSARPAFKAPGGFGATLSRIEQLGQWVLAPKVAAA
ncbi:glycosyltransferase [Variovorax sp. HJSM1_2]|uniref:glycosyltransferase n=1 Tax=Variovorax sp. HJSM1_2 TaxID=3366263 RepID=UPI003BE00EB6